MKCPMSSEQNFQKIPGHLGKEETWLSAESGWTAGEEPTYLASYAGSRPTSTRARAAASDQGELRDLKSGKRMRLFSCPLCLRFASAEAGGRGQALRVQTRWEEHTAKRTRVQAHLRQPGSSSPRTLCAQEYGAVPAGDAVPGEDLSRQPQPWKAQRRGQPARAS